MNPEPTSRPEHRPSSESALHRARFKETPEMRAEADRLRIDGAELGTAYHHVEEIGGEKEAFTPRKMNRDDNEIDMTPMVDTTFLLLLFFMITAAFSLQKSLQVPTPKPEEPSTTVVQRDPSDDPDTVTVHVDENNSYRVVTTDVDVEAPSIHELVIRLREARDGNRSGRKPTKLLVVANEEAMHDRVVAAMDAGSQVEMEEIRLMMVEENE
jgi:biopolymer transport protein ExbD